MVLSASYENFYFLCEKSIGKRLDIVPFVIIYLLITYAYNLEYVTDTLYIKFMLLITFFLHGMVFLIGNWNIKWKLIIHYTKVNTLKEANCVLIEGLRPDGAFYTDVCEIEKGEELTTLHYQKKKYHFDFEKNTFIRFKPDLKKPIEYFLSQITTDDFALQKNFDKNLLEFPLPNFNKIFKEQLMDPLNFFQLFSVALWFFDDNFWHPIFTLVMVIVSIFTVAIDRMTTMMNLRSLILKPQYIYCCRNENWIRLTSDELVPGDIVSIRPSASIKEPKKKGSADDDISLLRKNIPFGDKLPAKMFTKMRMQGSSDSKPVLPCDLLLLSGSCVVDESILTGESVPLIKDPITNVPHSDEILDLSAKHKGNTLYCGTEVLQNFAPEGLPSCVSRAAPDGGAIAYVLKTGFDTEKGKLARSVIFNNENMGLKQTEAFLLLGILLILSMIASGHVLRVGLEDEKRDKQKLFLRCIMIITSVVPPELPMIMNISINYSMMYLRNKKIFCTEPVRIPLAGKVNICAFDKTGTLTTDKLEVVGIAEDVNKGTLTSIVNSSTLTRMVLGGCHTLVVHAGELLGDPIEMLFFNNCDFKYDHSNKLAYNTKNSSQKITIEKVFPFRSDLKRMSSICKVQGFPGDEGRYVFSKGAPEVIAKFLAKKTDAYDALAKSLMKEGYRVICLAYRRISIDEKIEDREQAEKNLTFAGLLVLNCPLKKDTKHYINLLAEAKYHNIMITGDSMYTAAKTGHHLKFGSESHLFLRKESKETFGWVDIHDKPCGKLTLDFFKKDSKDHCLCVEGDAMKLLETSGDRKLFEAVINHAIIFARVSPEQKEQIVTILREHGKGVLMCGDGTNDVGALKKSDVGIALVGLKDEPTKEEKKKEKERKQQLRNEALKARRMDLLSELGKEEDTEFKSGDACIAAPFTNKFSNSIKCVVTIIRQGICTMTSAIQTYKILTLQSLILAYSMSSLHLENLKTSDMQNTTMGIIGAYYFFQLSNSKPVKKLPEFRPDSSIFTYHFWMSIIGQAIILLGGMLICLHWSREYSLEEELEIDNEKEFEPTFRNSMMFLFDLISMFCISIFNQEGRPFMVPLTEKKGHLKWVLSPLIITLLVCLDVSDDINSMLEITLDANDPYANLIFCGLFVGITSACYFWTRWIKKLRYGQTYGYL